MKNELGLLNLICIVLGLLFIVAAVLTALFYPPLLSTDNLFIIMVCMVMALVFMSNPLLYLHSEGRLPIPLDAGKAAGWTERKSTRLNSNHGYISYAVFCLKKNNNTNEFIKLSNRSSLLDKT